MCACEGNAKCPFYIGPDMDGLAQSWSGVCWMNPPYGRDIALWVKKAWEESQRGATVVCLLPVSASSAWWHDYVIGAEIRWLRGRIKFEGAKWTAPFSSCVVVFRPSAETPSHADKLAHLRRSYGRRG